MTAALAALSALPASAAAADRCDRVAVAGLGRRSAAAGLAPTRRDRLPARGHVPLLPGQRAPSAPRRRAGRAAHAAQLPRRASPAGRHHRHPPRLRLHHAVRARHRGHRRGRRQHDQDLLARGRARAVGHHERLARAQLPDPGQQRGRRPGRGADRPRKHVPRVREPRRTATRTTASMPRTSWTARSSTTSSTTRPPTRSSSTPTRSGPGSPTTSSTAPGRRCAAASCSAETVASPRVTTSSSAT